MFPIFMFLQTEHKAERESWRAALGQVEQQLRDAQGLLDQRTLEVLSAQKQHASVEEEVQELQTTLGEERQHFTAVKEAQVGLDIRIALTSVKTGAESS